MAGFWDSERTIEMIEKNDRGDKIVIKEVTKNQRAYIDIRNYYRNILGELCPGKGIAIPEELFDSVVEALVSIANND
jgi:hypothetical protein